MFAPSLPITRRRLLAGMAAAGAVSAVPATAHAALEIEAVRPFQVNIPDVAIADLHRRLAATRWPARETVTDQAQGV
jgi:hypothetical protein